MSNRRQHMVKFGSKLGQNEPDAPNIGSPKQVIKKRQQQTVWWTTKISIKTSIKTSLGTHFWSEIHFLGNAEIALRLQREHHFDPPGTEHSNSDMAHRYSFRYSFRYSPANVQFLDHSISFCGVVLDQNEPKMS